MRSKKHRALKAQLAIGRMYRRTETEQEDPMDEAYGYYGPSLETKAYIIARKYGFQSAEALDVFMCQYTPTGQGDTIIATKARHWRRSENVPESYQSPRRHRYQLKRREKREEAKSSGFLPESANWPENWSETD